MKIRNILIYTIVALCSTINLAAQSYSHREIFDIEPEQEQTPFLEVDTTLFRLPAALFSDHFGDATRYYRPFASSRKGVYYTTHKELFATAPKVDQEINIAPPDNYSTLYATNSYYRLGGYTKYNNSYSNGWSIATYASAKLGNNAHIEGAFLNSAQAEITATKLFGEPRHHLTLTTSYEQSTRGEQYSSTQEVFALRSTNYYNPTWGVHNNELRNSRIKRSYTPTLTAHYQRPLNHRTTAAIDTRIEASKLKRSGIAWYNASNPMPDYYTKLPSAMEYGQVRDAVTQAWLADDLRYTQLNWDAMQFYNEHSPDGNAYYTLEDRVSQPINIEIDALAKSETNHNLTASYGIQASYLNTHYYKQMRDLLGADHLIDLDQFLADRYNIATNLQNDLQNPNRKIAEGDKFGYNYRYITQNITALLDIRYRAKRLDIAFSAQLSKEESHRHGNYEKERFAGKNSLGNSPTIIHSPRHIRAAVAYAIGGAHHLTLNAIHHTSSPYDRYQFMDIDDSNITVQGITPTRHNYLSLAHRYSARYLSIHSEIYALNTSDECKNIPYYDDLTRQMCRAITTDISTLGLGYEVVVDYSFARDWSWLTTIAGARYTYSKNPQVSLYSDVDFALISQPCDSRIEGLIIGNRPQSEIATTLTYFGFSGYTLRLNASYSGARYIEPSMLRRTDRVYASLINLATPLDEISEQQRLDDVFDIAISASRRIYFEDNSSLNLRIAINNLLNNRDRVTYARESNRLRRLVLDGALIALTPQPASYQYNIPCTILLSAGYSF